MADAPSPLEAIRADVNRPDSVLLDDMARAMIAGATASEAAAPGRASVSYAAVREMVPILREMRERGDSPETIRALVRQAITLQLGRLDGFLDAVAERALGSVLGPDPSSGPTTA